MNDDIAHIKELAAQATPGEWVVSDGQRSVDIGVGRLKYEGSRMWETEVEQAAGYDLATFTPPLVSRAYSGEPNMAYRNAAFIAAARTAVPDLIAKLEVVREVLRPLLDRPIVRCRFCEVEAEYKLFAEQGCECEHAADCPVRHKAELLGETP